MHFVNLVHEDVAGGEGKKEKARTRFLEDGGSGGGSVFSSGPVIHTSNGTLVEESAATRPAESPARQSISHLYYDGQPEGSDPIPVEEVETLLKSGVISDMTLVYSDTEVGLSRTLDATAVIRRHIHSRRLHSGVFVAALVRMPPVEINRSFPSMVGRCGANPSSALAFRLSLRQVRSVHHCTTSISTVRASSSCLAATSATGDDSTKH